MAHQNALAELPIISPPSDGDEMFTDAAAAVADLRRRYESATEFLKARFADVMQGGQPEGRYRAFYPSVGVTTGSFAKVDSRLSFGHVAEPGLYETTITRPDLFEGYLTQQIGLLIQNHGMPVRVGTSDTAIPLHFAMGEGAHVEGSIEDTLHRPLRDLFDVPDLNTTDDQIVNGSASPAGSNRPLAPFTAQRIDYSLARLAHYTATSPSHFQNHVLFTNYQFYMDEFVAFAHEALARPGSGYEALIEPGNVVTTREGSIGTPVARLPQMPTYHLTRPNHSGITMVNIGVGPSNAKTVTDHVAVLRPHVWLMLGHCAGLRNSQSLGDYVLAHAYMREDHVLDDDLPIWVPIPALAEVQVALENAVAEVTGLAGYELKKIMRTGHRRHHRQPQLGVARPVRPGAAPQPGSRDRARHGERDDRRQRLPLQGSLRDPALRLRQAAAWRTEAAGHGHELLQATGRATPPDRSSCARGSARDAAREAPFAQAPEFRRDGVSVTAFGSDVLRRDSFLQQSPQD